MGVHRVIQGVLHVLLTEELTAATILSSTIFKEKTHPPTSANVIKESSKLDNFDCVVEVYAVKINNRPAVGSTSSVLKIKVPRQKKGIFWPSTVIENEMTDIISSLGSQLNWPKSEIIACQAIVDQTNVNKTNERESCRQLVGRNFWMSRSRPL